MLIQTPELLFHKQWNYSDIQERLFWLQGKIIPQRSKLSWQRQRGAILLHNSQEPLFWQTWTIIQTAREQYMYFSDFQEQLFWLLGAVNSAGQEKGTTTVCLQSRYRNYKLMTATRKTNGMTTLQQVWQLLFYWEAEKLIYTVRRQGRHFKLYPRSQGSPLLSWNLLC